MSLLSAGLLPLLLAVLPQAPSAGSDAEGPASAGTADEPASIAFSNLVVPLYLGEEPPPARSLRHIQLYHSGVDRGRSTSTRTREEAAALAREIHTALLAGADFVEVAERYSEAPSARRGAVLGTFPAGLLAPELDSFLFAAEIGEVSEPIENALGFHVLQRVERWAGGMQILVRTEGRGEEAARERIEELRRRLEQGEDFGALAAEHSEDAFSAPRRGQLMIAERGPADVLLKKALFDAEVGEVVGPIRSPLGLHLVKRVPTDAIDGDLRESSWVRARAILIAFDGAPGAPPLVTRSLDEAAELALEVRDRIAAGEDMAALARELNDDTFGRERAGDLGWLYRRNPKMARMLDRLYTVEPGHLFEPTFTSAGWVVLRRER